MKSSNKSKKINLTAIILTLTLTAALFLGIDFVNTLRAESGIFALLLIGAVAVVCVASRTAALAAEKILTLILK